jgi:hypothetical protein
MSFGNLGIIAKKVGYGVLKRSKLIERHDFDEIVRILW